MNIILSLILLESSATFSGTMFPMSPVSSGTPGEFSNTGRHPTNTVSDSSEVFRLSISAEELGDVVPLRALTPGFQPVPFSPHLAPAYYSILPDLVRRFIAAQWQADRLHPESTPLLRFDRERIRLPSGAHWVGLGRRLARQTGSVIFELSSPHNELVVKYQANCDYLGLEHPLIRDYWFQHYLAPLGIGPRVHFLSPATRLSRVVTAKTSFARPLGEFLQCAADIRSHVRYMVMDRASYSVYERINRGSELLPSLRFRYAVQVMIFVVRILQELHARDVIHGDIHPGNVMGFNGTIGLIDFGLAKFGSELAQYPAQTATGYVHCYHTPYELDGFQYSFRDDLFRTLLVGTMLMHGQDYVDYCLQLESDSPRMHVLKKSAFLFDFYGDVTLSLNSVSSDNKRAIRERLDHVLYLARTVPSLEAVPPHSLILESLDAVKRLL